LAIIVAVAIASDVTERVGDICQVGVRLTGGDQPEFLYHGE